MMERCKKNPQSILGDDRHDFGTIPIMKRGQRREERWKSERGAVLNDADDELGVPTGRPTRAGMTKRIRYDRGGAGKQAAV